MTFEALCLLDLGADAFLDRLSALDPARAARTGLALARHVLAVAPPRPRRFADPALEADWRDDGHVEAALALAARIIDDGEPRPAEHTAALRRCAAASDAIAAAADDYDYDAGCGAVATVVAVLEAVGQGAGWGAVARCAVRVVNHPGGPPRPPTLDVPTLQRADDARRTYQQQALLPLVRELARAAG